MPVAIIVRPNQGHVILQHDDDATMLHAIAAHAPWPIADKDDAKSWLISLIPPSGWFANRRQALAFIKQVKALAPSYNKEFTSKEIRDCRKGMGLSRVQFARALGYKGNDNTINKVIHELEMGKSEGPSPKKTAMLATLLAAHELHSRL